MLLARVSRVNAVGELSHDGPDGRRRTPATTRTAYLALSPAEVDMHDK